MTTLKAEKRDMSVKAKKLRREGYVTGNVFGKEIEGSIPVKIEKKEAEKLLKTSFKGSRINLCVDGENYDVLIKEIDFNSLKSQVDEIDFQALVSGEAVHSVAEVILLNHDKALGVIQQHLEEIAYKALPSALVEKVEIDVAEMKVGDMIKVKDLAIASDKDVSLITDPEEIVVSLAAPHNADIPEENTEAAEGTVTE
ncbi:MAG: 50S ribosomal protein L25 [Candidatus Avilachnospira sp.]|jgi:large subunit ribosomal protein L25